MVMIVMVLLMMLTTEPLNVRMAKSSVSSEALVRVELEQGLHLILTIIIIIIIITIATIIELEQGLHLMIMIMIIVILIIKHPDLHNDDEGIDEGDGDHVGSFRGGGLEEVLEWATSHGARLVIIIVIIISR